MTGTTYRRIVVDTNVLVSAILFGGSIPAQALKKVVLTADLLVSAELLAELSQVLARPKFDPR